MEAVEIEVCPNCGSYADELVESTGWCRKCTTPYSKQDNCDRCGKETYNNKKHCGTCGHILFLENNADALEFYTSQGCSLEQAIRKVQESNRPRCICCYAPIYHAKQGAYFCTRSSECRSAKRRFRTLRQRYPKDLALQLVQQELLARSITGGNDGSNSNILS